MKRSVWAVVAGLLVVTALAVLAVPQCWLGAKIHEMQSGQR